MLTWGESVEAHALRKRGWSVSAIARHLDRDRKTVRAYLAGQREPGKRKPAGPDQFGRVAEYCRIRFADDPHLFATALFEEVGELTGAEPAQRHDVQRKRQRHCSGRDEREREQEQRLGGRRDLAEPEQEESDAPGDNQI